MDTNSPTPQLTDSDIGARLKERFDQLPKVVQDAITSADVQKKMREVANSHKLHLDQWGILENEVMLTLLGFQNPSELAHHIQSEVGLPAEDAAALAATVNTIVFEPIRQELERGLSHPAAKEKEVSATEVTRQAMLQSEQPTAIPTSAESPASTGPETAATISAPGVLPATPPPPPLTEKAVRAPISSSYSARQPSSERKIVEGDPYRELPQ